MQARGSCITEEPHPRPSTPYTLDHPKGHIQLDDLRWGPRAPSSMKESCWVQFGEVLLLVIMTADLRSLQQAGKFHFKNLFSDVPTARYINMRAEV